jgi:TetR/AcrR family transcriptional regulator, transcriptional repressor for nem operon
MARPRQSEATRERLLEAGAAAFLEHGYHGTGIKQVLDRVRVPKGSFYNYFQSKEEFGAEAILHYSRCFVAKLDAALEGAPDALEGLRVFFHRLMAEFEEAGYVGGCLVANLGGELEGSDVCRQALATAWGGWRDRVRDVLAEAQAEGGVRADVDAGELADTLVEAWEGAVIRMKIERSLEPLERCVGRLLDGYFRPDRA